MAIIRRFTERDLPRLLRIESQSFEGDAWPAELFLDYARASNCYFVVAEAGRTVAGYCVATLRGRSAEIASIAVLPKFRGHGIATMLLDKSLRALRAAGAPVVLLMVRRDNEQAIGLYRRFGFVRTATVRAYYADGATAWRMRLNLNNRGDQEAEQVS